MSECKHGYTSVLGAHRLICPYCEIDRLTAAIAKSQSELAEARESVGIVSTASNAYMVQASRYREALKRIEILTRTPPRFRERRDHKIAREALEGTDA